MNNKPPSRFAALVRVSTERQKEKETVEVLSE